MTSLKVVAVLAVAAAAAGPLTLPALLPQQQPADIHYLRLIKKFDLPGPLGKRFDYLTIDGDQHYLLSAHLGAGILYVIDLANDNVVKAIPDVPGVEGVEYVPGLKKAYTSDWHENKVGVVDLASLAVIKKLPSGDKPDGSAYAEPFHKLYVSDERGRDETVIDVNKDEVIRTLRFNSETGMPEYDPVARKLYVNLQGRKYLRRD